MEIEPIKKIKNEGNLGMKILGTWTRTSEASITNRMQELEDIISDI